MDMSRSRILPCPCSTPRHCSGSATSSSSAFPISSIPGANHTRFEHSLGTMFLADMASRRFGLPEDERTLVIVAALFHDIGHGPFSHASEPLMEAYLHHSHDDIGAVINEPEAELLSGIGIDPGELCAVVQGTHEFSGIIHSDLDVDRMDYLLRDAYYSGAPYGAVDAQRLIRHLIRTDHGIALDENGVNAADSLLIARTQMRPNVYFHHVSRIGESMFQLAVTEHIKGQTGPGYPGTAPDGRRYLSLRPPHI